MDSAHTHDVAWFKVLIAWLGVFLGGVTLSQVALILTIIFTLLQIYRQIRDIRKDRRLEKLEAVLKHKDVEEHDHAR